MKKRHVIATTMFLIAAALLSASTLTRWRRENTNRERLKGVGLSLVNYCATYDEFPPSIVRAPDGRPMHSWRVMLVPFLEQNLFFDAYDVKQPWDGPSNRKLHESYFAQNAPKPLADITLIRRRFQIAYVDPHSQFTNLVMVADKETRRRVVVALRSTTIHWMEPRDTSVSELLDGIAATNGGSIIGACIVSELEEMEVYVSSAAVSRLLEIYQ